MGKLDGINEELQRDFHHLKLDGEKLPTYTSTMREKLAPAVGVVQGDISGNLVKIENTRIIPFGAITKSSSDNIPFLDNPRRYKVDNKFKIGAQKLVMVIGKVGLAAAIAAGVFTAGSAIVDAANYETEFLTGVAYTEELEGFGIDLEVHNNGEALFVLPDGTKCGMYKDLKARDFVDQDRLAQATENFGQAKGR